MFTVHTPVRRQYFELPLSIPGLFLSGLLVFSIVGFAGPGSKTRQQFTIFDAPNSNLTQVGGINDAGAVTGYFFDASHRIHGFLREADGKFIVIDASPDAMETVPVGTNVRGQTAGIAEGGLRSFIRDKKGNIALFSAPDAQFTFASGINTRGDIAGMFHDNTGDSRGYERDSRGQITTFDLSPNGSDMEVSGITDRGEIAGTFADLTQGGRRRIYLRDRDGSLAFFDVPNGSQRVAGINNRGDIVGINIEEQDHKIVGFVRDRDGEIMYLKVPSPELAGINDRGDVVGTFGDPNQGGKSCGFVADSDGDITIIDVPDATGTYASGINNRGEISGSFDVAGLGSKRRGFIFRLDEYRR